MAARSRGAVAFVAVVLAAAAAAAGAQDARADGEPPADPISAMSQYVEQLPVAGGTIALGTGRPTRRPLSAKTKAAIKRSGGKDADTLARLAQQASATPVVSPSSRPSTPTSTPQSPPGPTPTSTPLSPPERLAGVERAQREDLRSPAPAPVSATAVSAALGTVSDGTDSRLIALVAILAALTVLAVLAGLRRGPA